MKKKKLLIPILIFTFFLIFFIIFINRDVHYQNLLISREKWEKIQGTKEEDYSLKVEKLFINDYPTIIDYSSHIIYTNMISFSKENPTVHFFSNFKNTNIRILEEEDTVSIMIYNNSSYTVYSLQKKTLPMVHLTYHEYLSKISDCQLKILDNQKKSTRKVIQSDASINIEDDLYVVSLRKESIGRNKRKNDISIFNHPKVDVFLLKKEEIDQEQKEKVELFVNHEYRGSYYLVFNERNGR